MSFNVEQSKHNIDSNRYLAKANPDYRDWEITTLFYSAIHLVNAYFLLATNKKPNTHDKRKKLIESELNSIYRDYYSLECLSRKARYEPTYQNLTPEEVNKAIDCYNAIFAHVKKQLQELGDDAVQPLLDGDFWERLR